MDKGFWEEKRILITGGDNFVAKYVVKLLLQRGVGKNQLVIPDSEKYDLRELRDAKKAVEGVDIVIHLAANSKGVGYSNSFPATQFRDCSLIDLAVFEAASLANVKKLITVSAAVSYPQDAPSPLKEEYLFQGVPGNTGYGFGFAKRNTVILARAYRQEKALNAVVLVPSNAYGPGQGIDLESGHVVPSLIYKCLKDKELSVWGDGKAIRDYLYAEDFAEGILLAAERSETSDPINLGSEEQISVKQLVDEIVDLTGFKGKISYDTTKPKGVPIKVVDISLARKMIGFKPKWTLHDGLEETVSWIKKQI